MALISPLWLHSELPVFRDAGHFYYPSFHYEHELWSQGVVPLWSSLDDLGRPFAADSSASVFYPGKAIFWLPLSFSTCVLLYLSTHLILACLNTFYLARRLKISNTGATLASLSFTLGGAVLTQHSNIIYLVSAAWLPLALCLSWDLLQKQCGFKSMAYLGITLALIVMGGDAQMALHIVLLIPLLHWFRHNHSEKGHTTSLKLLKRLSIAGILAFSFAAIQILPTFEWTQHGARKMRSASRTTFEWAADQISGKQYPNHIMQGSSKAEHHGQLYQFSLAPWQLSELALPNVTGKLYPERHRWTFALKDNPRTWYPSIYQGIVPLLLALSVIGLRRKSKHKQLSRVLIFAVLASLGSFGLGWILNAFISTESVADETGGIYWWLCNLVPGYIQFRYPAKWFVIASLLLALLAGCGWDSEEDSFVRRRTILQWTGIGLTASTLACFPLLSQLISTKLESASADPFLGPIVVEGVKGDLLLAAIQPLIVIVTFAILTKSIKQPTIVGTAVVMLLACDLLVANRWIFSSAPTYHWDATSSIEQRVKNSTRKYPSRIYRARLSRWNPPSFLQTSSQDRQRDALKWDRQSLRPRMHLLGNVQSLDANASISDANYDSALRVMRSHGYKRSDGLREPDAQGLALLGATYILAPPDFYPRNEPNLTQPTDIEDVSLTPVAEPYPFAWTVPDWESHPVLQSSTSTELDQHVEQIFYADGVLRDFRHWAYLESEDTLPHSKPIAHEHDLVELETFEPGFVRLRVSKQSAGPLIINQGFAPGWKVRIWDSNNTLAQPAQMVRANRVMQAVMLEQGEQTVDLIYRPDSFIYGLLLSGVSWLAVSISFLLLRRKQRKSTS